MKNVDLMREAGALAGYTIDSATGQDPTNKVRAQRRVNVIKADLISRYAGRWPANYREGWLALTPLYTTGSATFTNGSRAVVGSGTVWDSTMVGSKIKGPDNAYYKIVSVTDGTDLILSQPFQGTNTSGYSYQIWKDEYRLCPEVHAVGGFVDYQLPQRMDENSSLQMKDSYPYPVSVEEPTIYTIIGRKNATSYSTGTIATTLNSTTITGTNTLWLANIEPGFEMIINGYTYHVRSVNSDTSIDLYQQALSTIASTTYTANGKNALVVRFKQPTNQRIVHYWYWSKDYPFVNDSDEDWVAEMFPRVLIDGMAYFDFLDKNDVPRAMNSRQIYENSVKDMRVSVDNAYTGVRTLPMWVPPEARG